MGEAAGTPATFNWRWYYGFPTAILWILVAGLLLTLPSNRTGQAWLILVPLVVIALVAKMPSRLLGLPGEADLVLGIVVSSMATGTAGVWLLGEWLARRGAVARFAAILGIYLTTGVAAHLGYFGLAWDETMSVATSIFYGVCVLAWLAAVGLSARCCRRVYRPGAFMGWLALWTFATAAAFVFLSLSVLFMIESVGIGMIVLFAIQAAIGTVFVGGTLYLVNLPLLLLAFKSPLFGERFRDTCQLGEVLPKLTDAGGESPFSLPESTEPTTRPVAVDDLLGPWWFYVDKLSRTVLVDFHADGTFAQTIAENNGGTNDCPGGTWKLDEATVRIEGYTSAGHDGDQSRTWWFVDTPAGLALFGDDDSESGSQFCMTRKGAESV